VVLYVFQDIPAILVIHRCKNNSETSESYEPLLFVRALNHANILTNMMIARLLAG
jgi:hypothetical protein